MSDDIFTQITGIIAQKGCSGIKKESEEWQKLLSSGIAVPVQEQPKAQKTEVPEPIYSANFKQPPAAPAYPRDPVQTAPVPAQRPEVFSGNLPDDLDAMREIVRNCRSCRLCQSRQNTVFGEGNPHAQLMFIGEGPGADEDASGRPFVGAAGQLLDKMITAMQFARQEVYIANIVKCRPPHNRNPEPDEAASCIGYLKKQIDLIKPECIVLLGAVASKFLLEKREGVNKLRGNWMEYNGIPLMVTFHPSYLLRNPDAKRDAWSDLQKVMAKFGKFHKR